MDQVKKEFFDDQFQGLCAELKKQGTVGVLSKSFAERKTDTERVSFLLDHSIVHEHVIVPELKLNKSSGVATKLRNEGNKLFQKKDFAESVKKYTESVANAPHYRDVESAEGDSDLSLAHANRSAALFHMQLWEECLHDINSAMECSYPKKLMHKLFVRRAQCLMKLGNYHDAIAALEAAKEALNDAEIEATKKTTLIKEYDNHLSKCSADVPDELTNITDPFKDISCDRLQPEFDEGSHNESYPSLAEFCNVEYTPNQGRYLVAKRDILPGEIVLVEKPYASVLLPENYENFCHHCYGYSRSLLACARCTRAMYCSTICRTAAQESYHQYECGVLEIIERSGVGKFGHLALRTILKVTSDAMATYKENCEQGNSETMNSPLLQGCNDDGKYLADDYRTIHSLVTHSHDRTTDDLFRRSVVAVFLLKCTQKSGYLGSECEDKGMSEFIGGLLLSHLQSFPCNAHEIAEFELDLGNLIEAAPMELGAGIYSSLSLFNHSCDPRVNRNFYGDICVVRAIKTIRQGEEIADNYGAVYAVQSKDQRQKKLNPQYYFECECLPCKENWPLYPCIEHIQPTWRCEKCLAPMVDTNGILKCGKCNAEQSSNDRLITMSGPQEKYEKAFEELMTCNVDGSLPGLLSYLATLDKNLCLPWREYNNCQEAVKQCFSIMANCHIVRS